MKKISIIVCMAGLFMLLATKTQAQCPQNAYLTGVVQIIEPDPYNPPHGCAPHEIWLENNLDSLKTSSPIVRYICWWDFTGQWNQYDTTVIEVDTNQQQYYNNRFTHVYQDTGVYTIYLTMINAEGCEFSTQVSIVKVGYPPLTDFVFIPDTACKSDIQIQAFAYDSVDASGNLVARARANEWYWADDNHSPIGNPSDTAIISPNESGVARVILLSSHNGCFAEYQPRKEGIGVVCPPIAIIDKPKDWDRNPGPPIFCSLDEIDNPFEHRSQDQGAIYLRWYAGDSEITGDTANQTKSPLMVYDKNTHTYSWDSTGWIERTVTGNKAVGQYHPGIITKTGTDGGYGFTYDTGAYLKANRGLIEITLWAVNDSSVTDEEFIIDDWSGDTYYNVPWFNKCGYCEHTATQKIYISYAKMNFTVSQPDICNNVVFFDSTDCNVGIFGWGFKINWVENPSLSEYPIGSMMPIDNYTPWPAAGNGAKVKFSNANSYEVVLIDTCGLSCIKTDTLQFTTSNVTIDTTYSYSATFCQGGVYSDNYFTNLTQSGTYSKILETVNGCGMVYLNLLSVPITTHYSASICQGEVYNDDNFINLSETGTYLKTLQTSNGCDSIIYLNLSVSVPTFYSVSISPGDIYSDDNFTNLTQAGLYYDTLQSTGSCDSIICLYLYYGAKGSGGCTNLNLSMGDFTNWQCYSGTWTGGNIVINPTNPDSGRHTIMNSALLLQAGQLYDENCQWVKKVPDGFSHSARIGNSNAGAEVDAVEYTMTIDMSNSLLLVHFAWVMQYDSNRPSTEQPRFSMIIKDSAGNILDNIPCGEIDFTASAGSAYSSVRAKDWTTVGYGLDAYMGQTIKVYLEVRDCVDNSHYGYAYVVAECRSMVINLMYCAGQTAARFRAPNGFAHYTWKRSGKPEWSFSGEGRNYQNLTLTDVYDEVVTCEVTPALDNSCSVTLNTIVTSTKIDAKFQYGVMENGKVDFAGNNNQNWYDTNSRTVTFVDRTHIRNSSQASRTWYIHGLPDMSIPNDSMVTITFPNPRLDGIDSVVYLVRLLVTAENGCVDTSKAIANHYITIYAFDSTIIEKSTYLVILFSNDSTMGTTAFIQYDTNSDTVIFEAIPNAGYQFIQWDDGNTDNPRSIVLTQDTVFIAEFAIIGVDTIKANISGLISVANNSTTILGEVYLYLADPNEMRYLLIDSTTIQANGAYNFTQIPEGDYLLKTVAANIFNAVPTYYGNTENWSLATTISIRDTVPLLNKNIEVIVLNPLTGNSIISGYVGEEDDGTKSIHKSGVEYPSVGVTVLLKIKETLETIARTQTNEEGFFEFRNVPVGNYIVVIDIPGLGMVDFHEVEITEDGQVVEDLNYIVTEDGIETEGATNSIKQLSSDAKLSIYPNPTTGQLTIKNGQLTIEKVEIYDIYGRTVGANLRVCSQSTIDISHLANGIYLVKVKTEEGEIVKKIVKN
jgi:hypothetical protein